MVGINLHGVIQGLADLVKIVVHDRFYGRGFFRQSPNGKGIAQAKHHVIFLELRFVLQLLENLHIIRNLVGHVLEHFQLGFTTFREIQRLDTLRQIRRQFPESAQVYPVILGFSEISTEKQTPGMQNLLRQGFVIAVEVRPQLFLQ